MGFATPAAIGAAIAKPQRPVVATVGDGAFMMTGLELATAVHHKVRSIVFDCCAAPLDSLQQFLGSLQLSIYSLSRHTACHATAPRRCRDP